MRKPPRKRITRSAASDPVVGSLYHPYVMRFLEAIAVAGMAARTVETRHNNLKYFIGWCRERALERPQDITRPILESYRRFLYHYRQESGRPLTSSSQSSRLVTVRLFFKWLTRENLILANPASELELPRKRRRLPPMPLSADEIERIMQQTTPMAEIGIRDRAIMETLYSSGIRRQELAQLKLYDVDTRHGTIAVCLGKGDKDRYVPVGSRAIEWVERYSEEVRPKLAMEPDEGFLFLDNYGTPFIGSRLSNRVKFYVRAAGIDRRGSCHLFRHAMATQMLDNGADLRFIQALLGHEDISTTQIYTHVAIAKLKEIHKLTHPAERPALPQLVTSQPIARSAEAKALLADIAAEAEDEQTDMDDET